MKAHVQSVCRDFRFCFIQKFFKKHITVWNSELFFFCVCVCVCEYVPRHTVWSNWNTTNGKITHKSSNDDCQKVRIDRHCLSGFSKQFFCLKHEVNGNGSKTNRREWRRKSDVPPYLDCLMVYTALQGFYRLITKSYVEGIVSTW